MGLEPGGHVVQGRSIRIRELDGGEPGARRGLEPVQEGDLAEEEVQVGGEARHARSMPAPRDVDLVVSLTTRENSGRHLTEIGKQIPVRAANTPMACKSSGARKNSRAPIGRSTLRGTSCARPDGGARPPSSERASAPG